jgi:hypothetical protein
LPLVLLLVLYSGWWWVLSRDFEKQIDHWIASQQAQGARITPDRVSIGGYPLAFTVKLTGASLAWPNGLGFAPQVIKLRVRPWSLRSVSVSLTGGYTITIPPGDARPPLTVAGETMRGSAHFGDEPIPLSVSLRSDTVSVAPTASEASSPRELTVAGLDLNASRPEAPPKADTDIALDVSLLMLDVSAAAIESNPLGGAIKEMRVHAQLLGVPPATTDAAGLKVWRDAGGTVNAPELSVQWGPLGLSGAGTMALDGDMQPEGAFTAHLTGFSEALDALSAAGWIKMSVASLAKLGLGIASRPGPDGKPIVTTPVTIQKRQISLGAFKLGQVPLLHLD